MHEPPRSDAAGLQTPETHVDDPTLEANIARSLRHTPETGDGSGGWVMSVRYLVKALAALRVRAEGLHQELDRRSEAVEWEISQTAETLTAREVERQLRAELAALRASQETLQAERVGLQARIKFTENYETIRLQLSESEAQVAALDAEREAREAAIRGLQAQWRDELPRIYTECADALDAVLSTKQS